MDGIDFNVAEGEVFGLLGPDGAGKTTMWVCLEGLRYPTAATLRMRGIDPSREPGQVRGAIGVQLQTSRLPDTKRVEEAMRFFCGHHGIAPRLDVIERLGLEAKPRAEYVTLSAGQQRRLALALARAHDPMVVFALMADCLLGLPDPIVAARECCGPTWLVRRSWRSRPQAPVRDDARLWCVVALLRVDAAAATAAPQPEVP